MREITAAKLKQLFLDAFEHSLRSGSVDYIAACEEAFRDVRRMEQDYNSLVAAGQLVEALANGVKQRAVLRGKLHRLRSEEHTSELQSIMRISYDDFCLKKTNSTIHFHFDY